MTLATSLPLGSALFLALAFGACAKADSNRKSDVPVLCDAGPGVDQNSAQQLCIEAIDTLRAQNPDRVFTDHANQTSGAGPQMRLQVTAANDRAAGLTVLWITADGSQTKGVPLRTAFYDTSANKKLRQNFIRAFFQRNPLPF